MYAKTYAFALIAIWAFNACMAAPAPEAKPSHGCGCDCCCVERCCTVPYSSCIPIHTTHRLIPSSNCGCGYGGGYGGYGGGYGGYGGGYGGWGYGGCGYGCDGGYGGYGGWGYGGYGCGCGCC